MKEKKQPTNLTEAATISEDALNKYNLPSSSLSIDFKKVTDGGHSGDSRQKAIIKIVKQNDGDAAGVAVAAMQAQLSPYLVRDFLALAKDHSVDRSIADAFLDYEQGIDGFSQVINKFKGLERDAHLARKLVARGDSSFNVDDWPKKSIPVDLVEGILRNASTEWNSDKYSDASNLLEERSRFKGDIYAELLKALGDNLGSVVKLESANWKDLKSQESIKRLLAYADGNYNEIIPATIEVGEREFMAALIKSAPNKAISRKTAEMLVDARGFADLILTSKEKFDFSFDAAFAQQLIDNGGAKSVSWHIDAFPVRSLPHSMLGYLLERIPSKQWEFTSNSDRFEPAKKEK